MILVLVVIDVGGGDFYISWCEIKTLLLYAAEKNIPVFFFFHPYFISRITIMSSNEYVYSKGILFIQLFVFDSAYSRSLQGLLFFNDFESTQQEI